MLEELVDRNGILLRRDVIAAGVDDSAIRRAVRAGTLLRLRHGAYVASSVWRAAGPEGRHRLTSRAVLRQYDDRVALSHVSAAVAHGCPSWGLDLESVHLTCLDGHGERHAAGITHHRGGALVDDLTRLDGHWITSPTRTALDVALVAGRDAAVCVLDDMQHRGLTTREELLRLSARMTGWAGGLALHRRIQLSDGRAASVGETRTRLVILDFGLPAPELQWVVTDADGRLAGIADFAWPGHRLLGEFDGRAKYLDLRRAGESVADAVLREKRREDLLRELTGWSMIRFEWRDLEEPERLAARLDRALTRRAA